MKKFILELRRREVFRSAGLYAGICWILIEGASIVLPAFDAPEWIMRFLIIAAILGFPVTLVLAWIYDVSDKGIVVQADATDTVVLPFAGRKSDLTVIGLLAVALIFSVYLQLTREPEIAEAIDPFSVLIADFKNDTGDPLFEGSLEQGLQIGIDGASFISIYERGIAQKVGAQLRDTDKLDSVTAQLVAAREGIKLVLVGSIAPRGNKFDLSVKAIVPTRGEIVAEADATATNKLEVLAAIGKLAADLREELGDKSVDREALQVSETFTAMSLEAARDYDTAQRLQYNGNYEKAIEHYRAAVEHDPSFGRAYSGWAVAARALGRLDEATTAWKQAMAHLGSMTERERLRTQGMYYWGVTGNFQKAIETFETLVEKYPADHVGHNNLAVQYFMALDFESARREGRQTVAIYPKNAIARSNYALYAMYSSDFDLAAAEADEVRELDATWFAAWLPIAMKALSVGDFDTARAAYNSMAETSGRGASTASLGLADIELLAGDFGAAQEILEAGIPVDEANGNNYSLAVKYMALGEALLAQGNRAAALEAVDRGVALTGSNAALVPAAFIYIAADMPDEALAISETLVQKLSPQPRAYAALIEALVALEAGNHVQAIEQLTGALEIADLWLLRFHLGRAYFEADYFVEAVDELTAARQRQGEASALFLDDLPTYHHAATLPYWLGRAQAELGMSEDAAENFTLFLTLRPAGGPLTDDARQRLP
jgi:tetratricopeptide (TPR) repeat protein